MTRKFRRAIEKQQKKLLKKQNKIFLKGNAFLEEDCSALYSNHYDMLLQQVKNVSEKININSDDVFLLFKKWSNLDVPECVFLQYFDEFDIAFEKTIDLFLSVNHAVDSISKIINKNYKDTVLQITDAYERDWFDEDADTKIVSSYIYNDTNQNDLCNQDITATLETIHNKLKEFDLFVKNKEKFNLGALCEQINSLYAQSLYIFDCAEIFKISYKLAIEKTLIIQNSIKRYVNQYLVDDAEDGSLLAEGSEYFFDIIKQYHKDYIQVASAA